MVAEYRRAYIHIYPIPYTLYPIHAPYSQLQLRQSGGQAKDLLPAPSVLPTLYAGPAPNSAVYGQYPIPYGQYPTETPAAEQQARAAICAPIWATVSYAGLAMHRV